MRLCTSAALVVIAGAAAPVFAALSQSNLAAPGGFVQVGVSPVGQGHFTNPGNDFELLYDDAGDDFMEASFSGAGSVTRSASATTAQTSGSSTATVSMGLIKCKANSTSPSQGFANGGAHGGFKENFVVTGGAPGADGWMLVEIAVSGVISASGSAGSAGFSITGYKDEIMLRKNDHWDNGASDPIATDRQFARWGVSTFPSDPSESRTVSDTIVFAVPIEFGEPFTFGIYGFAAAGKRSSSGVGGASTASIDFSNTIRWAGVRAVLDETGAEVESYNVSGDTNTDWVGGVIECRWNINTGGTSENDVDAADLADLLNTWGQAGVSADQTGAEGVDAEDLANLLNAWGPCD